MVSISDIASAAQIGLPGLATPALPGSMASTAVSAARGLAAGLSTFRPLGLAMRFSVNVAGARFDGIDLGAWTSCEGLNVKFEYETIRSGGEYGSAYILPKYVSFEPVTLMRAVERPYSDAVQTWLRLVSAQWQTAMALPSLGDTVTISMFDAYQNPDLPAATWQLQNAFPVAWRGPSMSAKGREIGSETLVFEHDGFLEPSL